MGVLFFFMGVLFFFFSFFLLLMLARATTGRERGKKKTAFNSTLTVKFVDVPLCFSWMSSFVLPLFCCSVRNTKHIVMNFLAQIFLNYPIASD